MFCKTYPGPMIRILEPFWWEFHILFPFLWLVLISAIDDADRWIRIDERLAYGL